jgi:Rad3-related DNA helicase
MFAPSLDRGIDLPYDLCGTQIIAKVPFLYLGDKQISARMHSPGGGNWYTVHTIRTIVQMSGRGMRSADDYCTTYILDSQFTTNLYKRSSNLFPQWWRDAVEIKGNWGNTLKRKGAW